MSKSLRERLTDGSHPGEGGCRIWHRATFARGYGALNVGGTNVRVHRLAYELECGPIPRGMVVDHVCGERLCIEPAHLRAVTNTENVQYRTKLNRNNTSGYRGVHWSKSRQRWIGEVKVDRKKFTKSFATAEAANKWVIATREEQYALGEFAREEA